LYHLYVVLQSACKPIYFIWHDPDKFCGKRKHNSAACAVRLRDAPLLLKCVTAVRFFPGTCHGRNPLNGVVGMRLRYYLGLGYTGISP